MNINIKYFDEKYNRDLKRLMRSPKGDWIDLYIPKTIEIEKGDFQIIGLGVAMALPQGTEAIIAPRSSTFKNWGLLHAGSIGIIDNSYCGEDDEWKLPVYATSTVTIPADTRLCQFRIFFNQPTITFKESTLSFVNRGGFGSTGV